MYELLNFEEYILEAKHLVVERAVRQRFPNVYNYD